MKTWGVLIAVIMILIMLLACGKTQEQLTLPPELTVPVLETTSKIQLTPNPVETSKPIYGGTLLMGYTIPRSFDGHQFVSWGPACQLPVFNQLVMFDINYKECVLETIVGDLAESWERSPDGMSITFKLHQGVKFHDGMPFTSDDVIYSLDKMNDVRRSAIKDWFPAYESTEKIDDYTVKVHLKYPSAGFLIALAQGESQIQPIHLAGTSDQSAAFMVGTGPFMLEDYLVRVHIKYKRNPDYFKKDRDGTQLPYLDRIVFYDTSATGSKETLASRRTDIMSTVTGAASTNTYNFLVNAAPELLWQRREKDSSSVIFLNLKHKPLDDIRVRRALGLVTVEEDQIIGYSGDVKFGTTDIGLLPRSFGLPKEEIVKLMGWDKPMEERVAEAQQLMAEAGYPDGFKLNMLAGGTSGFTAGQTLVFAEALRKYLKIDAVVNTVSTEIESSQRIREDNYDTYTEMLKFGADPAILANNFVTDANANISHYSSPEADNLLKGLDYILDPDKRRETILEIERVLLTDLPALPTGCFIPNLMPYYPWVKNLRWNGLSYSNICRLEDVWIDESLRVK